MHPLIFITAVTSAIQAALMAFVFVDKHTTTDYIVPLALSALAHAIIFVVLTHTLATLYIKKSYALTLFVAVISAEICDQCFGYAGKILQEVRGGAVIPNADIACFSVYACALSIGITLLCFIIYIIHSNKLLSAIRAEMETDRAPLT